MWSDTVSHDNSRTIGSRLQFLSSVSEALEHTESTLASLPTPNSSLRQSVAVPCCLKGSLKLQLFQAQPCNLWVEAEWPLSHPSPGNLHRSTSMFPSASYQRLKPSPNYWSHPLLFKTRPTGNSHCWQFNMASSLLTAPNSNADQRRSRTGGIYHTSLKNVIQGETKTLKNV